MHFKAFCRKTTACESLFGWVPARGRDLVSPQDWAQVSGDRNYTSAHPVMQKLYTRIYDLTVALRGGPACKGFFPWPPGPLARASALRRMR